MSRKTNLDVGLIKRRMQFIGADAKSVGYRMGVSPDMVRGWINTGEASPENARRLAEALGLTITEITCAA